MPIGQIEPEPITGENILQQPLNRLTTIGLSTGLGYAMAYALDLPLNFGLVAPIVALAGPYLLELYLDNRQEKPEALPQPNSATLRVEYVSDDKRHWILDEYPIEITIGHIRHIARRVIVDGMTFSRRNIIERGILSQNVYEAIQSHWLRKHFAYVQYPNQRNSPTLLTERCRRMLKKSLQSI